MTIKHTIWRIAETPTPLAISQLASERQLEDMIVAAPSILNDQWMLIGRQVDTGFSGRLDLLAIAPDASLVLVELKRDKTPRDVVAQAIDYASYVDTLKPEDIQLIYSNFKAGCDLLTDFKQRFGVNLELEALNASHQIVVVASYIDDSTKRIVNYLSDRDISINVLCFQVFQNGDERFLSRVWLLDPTQVQITSGISKDEIREPWNGEIYASYGQGESRSWEEALKYGFISAGGGGWYSNTLNLLSPGDRIWVKAPGKGFVGVAKVLGKPVRLTEFEIETEVGRKAASEVLKEGSYHKTFADDPEKSEYFVPVKWLDTVPLDKGVQGIGLFGNQNTVCKPTSQKWRHTIEHLKTIFKKYNNV